MKPFPSLRAASLCLGLGALVLTGCRSTPQVSAIDVSSPPPPLVGSVPIAAYDEYAAAVAPATKVRIEAVAQAGTR